MTKSVIGGSIMLSNRKVVPSMILEFSCSNHKSIKNEIIFSTIAGSDDTMAESLKEFSNYRVLPVAVIYGANGSGKSNFINALAFLKTLVCKSINNQPGQGIMQVPHKLNTENIPSEYKIQFVKNDIRYVYSVSILNNSVNKEYLYYFPKGRQVKIFERIGMEVKLGDKYKKNLFENSFQALKENRLFLSCAANFSRVNEIEEAFLFFRKDIVLYDSENNNWTEYSINLMQENVVIKQLFIDILKALGTGIIDVKVKLDKMKVRDLSQDVHIPEAIRTMFATSEAARIEAKVIYEQFETDLMTEESNGIKKLFEIVCPIIDILINGRILICDEIEKSLHESLACEIVKLFKMSNNGKSAQLIFSTHDTSLLDCNLFRRDQVWFTELNKERATDLYSLVELKNVRKTENLKKGYILGRYGAIPMINDNFFQTFADEL